MSLISTLQSPHSWRRKIVSILSAFVPSGLPRLRRRRPNRKRISSPHHTRLCRLRSNVEMFERDLRVRDDEEVPVANGESWEAERRTKKHQAKRTHSELEGVECEHIMARLNIRRVAGWNAWLMRWQVLESGLHCQQSMSNQRSQLGASDGEPREAESTAWEL